jgi:hypothetical protein
MSKFNTEDLLNVSIITGIIGLALGAVLGAAVNPTSAATTSKRRVNMDYVETEQRYANGVWMWHVYYDDGEFEYETSDHALADAMKSMQELVNM